jgi:hypothetical protein
MILVFCGAAYNTVYAVRADALTQIAPLRSATSHTPETLSKIPFLTHNRKI